ncbi:hypothetical protein B0H12DRAFT_1320089 [Mycena haematopus]|nr:hypothetical protein B0H12DRAFT_1320089 [Mycena haematopus]
MAHSDSHSSDDDGGPPPQASKRIHRGRDVSPVKTPPPRSRKSSTKQATTDKENLDAMKAKIALLEKRISTKTAAKKKKTPKAQDQGPLHGRDDDEIESEEPMSGRDDGQDSDVSASFPSMAAIKPLGEVPLPSQIAKPVKLRRTKRSTEPKTAAHAFIQLPEGSTEEQRRDALPDSDVDNDVVDLAPPSTSSLRPRGSSPPRSSSLPPRSPGSGGRYKRPHSPTAPLPPSKRSKPVPRTAEFRQGFTQVAGVKPAAGDYTDVPHALILRACADYSARIIAREAYPDVPLQASWGDETFKAAGRVAKERYLITARISKIIRARGSQKRGKMVEAYRALCASHFGFQRSTATKHIEANRQKAAALLEGAAFHYKDPKTRTGYGGNKIITAARQATTFKARDSSGVLFPSYFDPYPVPAIAFDLTTLEFVIREWSSGSFIQGKFTEKEVGKRYRVHLADTETWSKLDEAVVKKIRHNWYRRASETFLTEPASQVSTNIDDAAIAALRAELAGRTGDTDSEAEMEIDAEV